MAINGVNKKFDTVGLYPSPLLPKETKSLNSYGIQYAKAMLQEYEKRDYVLRQKRRDRIQYLRAVAEGSQTPEEYIDLLFDPDNTLYVNLDFSVPPVIPKFVDILVNKVVKGDYYIDINAPSSNKIREAYKRDKLADIVAYHESVQLAESMGVEAPSPPPFTTPNDLEIHMMTDFKLSSEIAAERGLQVVFDRSKYKEVEKRVTRDVVTVGLGATKTCYDVDGNIEVFYVDIENFLYSFSSDPDFRRAQHAGEMRVVTIAELRRESGFDEDTLFAIAKKWAGKNNNPDRISNTSISTGYSENLYAYDSFSVTVLDFQFLSSCDLVYEKKQTSQGYHRMDKRVDNYDQIIDPDAIKGEMKKTTYKAKFGGTWVIDTDYIYDYGEKTSPLRKWRTFFDTELDYTVYGTNWYKQDNKSLEERMVPYAKQMIAAHLKIQHLVMKSRPNGLAIDVSGLKDIDIDGTGEDASPMKIISVYDQTGNLLYNGLDDDGFTEKRPPIIELANGVPFQQLQSLVSVYNFNLQAIRDVVGLNEVTDASTPNSEMLVGVQQVAMESSNNATHEVFLAWESITVRTAEKVVLLLQEMIRKNAKAFESLIGEGSVAALKHMRTFEREEFGFAIELEPTQEQRMYLEQNIQKAIEQGLLGSTDAFIIRQARNFKVAQVILGMKEEQNRQRLRQEQQEDIMLNSETQQQIAVVSEQAKQQTYQMTLQGDLQKLQAEHMSKRDLLMLEYQLKFGEQGLKNDGSANVATIQATGKEQMEREKEDRKDQRDARGKEMESELIKQRETGGSPRKFTEQGLQGERPNTVLDSILPNR